MASEAKDIKGKFTLHVFIYIKAEYADAFQPYLAKIRASANSDAEPGCLTFRTSRFENNYAIFEEYVDEEAFIFHRTTAVHKEMEKVIGEYFAKPSQLRFFSEFH